MSKIGIATQRVLFLLDCTLLPAEDIQLNTRVFQWPKDMASVFDLAKTRTGHRRDQVNSVKSDLIYLCLVLCTYFEISINQGTPYHICR